MVAFDSRRAAVSIPASAAGILLLLYLMGPGALPYTPLVAALGVVGALRRGGRVVRCAYCGAVIDPGKAYRWRGKYFCSRSHKEKYRRRHARRVKPPPPAPSALEKVYWRRG